MDINLNRVLTDIGQTIAGEGRGVLASSLDLIIWNGLAAEETGTPTVILRYHQGIIRSFDLNLEGAFLDIYRELEKHYAKRRPKRYLTEVSAIFRQVIEELGTIGLALQGRFSKPVIARYGSPRFRVSFRLFGGRPTVQVVRRRWISRSPRH
jgi:hypothetical protein